MDEGALVCCKGDIHVVAARFRTAVAKMTQRCPVHAALQRDVI
jgi:hypothetical protein